MDKRIGIILCVLLWQVVPSCDTKEDLSMPDTIPSEQAPVISADSQAVVTDVKASGNEGAYTFKVTLASPDLGCSQYADWWEVLTADSILLYRRILTHSHVDEQPFTRSGGPVKIDTDEEVLVRGHMNNFGYGQIAFRGTVAAGFVADTLSASYASRLEILQPLPQNCAF